MSAAACHSSMKSAKMMLVVYHPDTAVNAAVARGNNYSRSSLFPAARSEKALLASAPTL
jgi:hypothetical protein